MLVRAYESNIVFIVNARVEALEFLDDGPPDARVAHGNVYMFPVNNTKSAYLILKERKKSEPRAP
jgi:hypothetical protein